MLPDLRSQPLSSIRLVTFSVRASLPSSGSDGLSGLTQTHTIFRALPVQLLHPYLLFHTQANRHGTNWAMFFLRCMSICLLNLTEI